MNNSLMRKREKKGAAKLAEKKEKVVKGGSKFAKDAEPFNKMGKASKFTEQEARAISKKKFFKKNSKKL